MCVSNTCLCDIVVAKCPFSCNFLYTYLCSHEIGMNLFSHIHSHASPTFLVQTLNIVSMKKVGQECVSWRNRVILVLGLLSKAQVGEALQVKSPRGRTKALYIVEHLGLLCLHNCFSVLTFHHLKKLSLHVFPKVMTSLMVTKVSSSQPVSSDTSVDCGTAPIMCSWS